MPFTVLLAPGGMASGVPAGCHNSNSQSAGRAHTCTILVGGGVKCWGRGYHGRLGYDSTDGKGDAAGEMAGLGTVNLGASAIAITAGSYHTCAIFGGGGVKCWGRGTYGQLGYGSTDHKGDAAGEMAGLGTINLNASAIAITAGFYHTCAILVGGGVKCWGRGDYGQLGYDSTDHKGDAAGEMAGLGTVNLNASAIAITAGEYHTCAILVGGGVKCWGRGDYGQLGYGSTDHKGDAAGEMESLGTINLNASAIAITAGFYHTCAILVGGGVKCWGRGDYGQLGYDSTDNKGDTAGEMAGLGTVNLGASAIALAAGEDFTCAILAFIIPGGGVGGGVKCWGRGDYGQLGYDRTDNKGDAAGEMAGLRTVNLGEMADDSLTLSARAIAITAGRFHTCATLVDFGVKCWGRGTYGQLGYDSTDDKGDAAGEMAGLGTVDVGASVNTCPLQYSPPLPPMPPSSPPLPPSPLPSPPPPPLLPPSQPTTAFDFSSATSPCWSNGGGDPPYAFTKSEGGTPSSSTGPSAGVGGSGPYFYAEASSPSQRTRRPRGPPRRGPTSTASTRCARCRRRRPRPRGRRCGRSRRSW